MEDIKVSLVALIGTKTRQEVTDIQPYHEPLHDKDGWLVTFKNGAKAFCTMKLSMQANGALDDPKGASE